MTGSDAASSEAGIPGPAGREPTTPLRPGRPGIEKAGLEASWPDPNSWLGRNSSDPRGFGPSRPEPTAFGTRGFELSGPEPLKLEPLKPEPSADRWGPVSVSRAATRTSSRVGKIGSVTDGSWTSGRYLGLEMSRAGPRFIGSGGALVVPDRWRWN